MNLLRKLRRKTGRGAARTGEIRQKDPLPFVADKSRSNLTASCIHRTTRDQTPKLSDVSGQQRASGVCLRSYHYPRIKSIPTPTMEHWDVCSRDGENHVAVRVPQMPRLRLPEAFDAVDLQQTKQTTQSFSISAHAR